MPISSLPRIFGNIVMEAELFLLEFGSVGFAR